MYMYAYLYGRFGNLKLKQTVEDKIEKNRFRSNTDSREITVDFSTAVADGMSWKFVPCQQQVYYSHTM